MNTMMTARVRNWKRFLSNRLFLSNTGIFFVLILGLAYLASGILRINPVQSSYSVTVNLAASGGLQKNSDVTMRGVRIGKITDIGLNAEGVVVQAKINDEFKISSKTLVSVMSLSAAGEQYLDFRPEASVAPYLGDGDFIGVESTSTPTTFSSLLESVSDVIAQVDPGKFNNVVTEMSIALSGGSDQLKALVDGGNMLFGTFNSLLPETLSLIEHLRVIVNTTGFIQPDLQEVTSSVSSFLDDFSEAEAELRTLLDDSPNQLGVLDANVSHLNDPIKSLLSVFTGIADQGRLRVPALREFIPSISYGLGKWSVAFHDGALWGIGNFYPRPVCDYENITPAPELIEDTTVPLALFCPRDDPNSPIRGAANAPRPPGDDTFKPAPGSSGLERSNPIPIG
ncbi:MAG: MlaD family protein [Mycobacteriaceae bacterium]